MSIKGISLFGLCIAGAVALSGCGGSSGSSPAGPTATNAVFEGVYVAPFKNSGSNTDTGEYAINITSSGAITGFYIDETGHFSDQITSGQINITSNTATTDTGQITVTNSQGTLTGTFIKSGSNLTGSVSSTQAGLTVNFSSGLANVAGGNAFAGWYQGTYVEPSVSANAVNLVAIVDASGNITWLQNQATPSTGTINSSTGLATFTPSGNTVHSGDLTLSTKSDELTGTLTNSSQGDPLQVQMSYDAIGL